MTDSTAVTLLGDRDWRLVADVACRVLEFHPFLGARIENNVVVAPVASTPYASVRLECARMPRAALTGSISHKLDFQHLWTAFYDSAFDPEREEVVIYWSRSHYRKIIVRMFAYAMPRLIVMICRRGTFDTLSDGLPWPAEESGMVMAHALESREWWKPDIVL